VIRPGAEAGGKEGVRRVESNLGKGKVSRSK
jgi:hypothetical protein